MAGRSRRKAKDKPDENTSGVSQQEARQAALADKGCWLCGRELGKQVQWHHAIPKSRGGKDTVPVHPICHSTLHATFTNTDLERFGHAVETLRETPAIRAFLRWVANKPPDFHAPTRTRRKT